eukprot:3992904-Amphidinium_carterae.1
MAHQLLPDLFQTSVYQAWETAAEPLARLHSRVCVRRASTYNLLAFCSPTVTRLAAADIGELREVVADQQAKLSGLAKEILEKIFSPPECSSVAHFGGILGWICATAKCWCDTLTLVLSMLRTLGRKS